MGIAASVPKVPGATRINPTPNPIAMKCAGCATRKRASGAAEMVEPARVDLHDLAVGAEEAHALAALHLADACELHAEHLGELRDALARVRGRREAELV